MKPSNTQQNQKNKNQTLSEPSIQERINAVLHTQNPNRIQAIKNMLQEVYPSTTGKTIIEHIARIDGSNDYSFFWEVVNDPAGPSEATTGWVLFNDGCFYHGTFDMGVFIADPNPYTDAYVGNEPVCSMVAVIDVIC